MNNSIVKILVFALLLLVVLAPFAGLAPLLLFLLVAGVGNVAWSLLKVILVKEPNQERES